VSETEPAGSRPDYRFSLANERTYLAWIRTALALDAAGLAVAGLLPPLAVRGAREAVALALVALGTVAAVTSYRRWVAYEDALRTDAALPSSRLPLVLAVGVSVVAVVSAVLLVVAQLT
jgi:putative membrane protein